MSCSKSGAYFWQAVYIIYKYQCFHWDVVTRHSAANIDTTSKTTSSFHALAKDQAKIISSPISATRTRLKSEVFFPRGSHTVYCLAMKRSRCSYDCHQANRLLGRPKVWIPFDVEGSPLRWLLTVSITIFLLVPVPLSLSFCRWHATVTL